MYRRQITMKLARRKDGSYCKYVNNKMYYFGHAGGTRQDAERELYAFIEARRAGGTAFQPGMSAGELASRYADDREDKVGASTWLNYWIAIRDFVRIVGKDIAIGSLNAGHFETVAREWRRRLGGNPFNNRVQSVRTMFKWAEDRTLIERVPRYGPAFKKMPAAEVRETQHGTEPRPFTSGEIEKILAAADPKMRLFFLLGLNGGMYSLDISRLTWGDICRADGVLVIDNVREKKGIRRLVPLWPEIELPKRGADDALIFTTIHGKPWVVPPGKDSIGLAFRRLTRRLGVHREGVGFGSVRHTHITAVGDHPDAAAKSYVVGHQIQGITKHYDRPSVARCKVVTDLARQRLLKSHASEPEATREHAVERSRKSARRVAPSAARSTFRRTRAEAGA